MTHANSMRLLVALALISAAATASAAAQCTAITGGNTAVSVIGSCVACATLSPRDAIDGNPSTAASVNVLASIDGGNGIRATAQRGIVYPAGSRPGVLMKLSKTGSVALDAEGQLRTYLNGRLQNQTSFDAGTVDVNGAGTLTGISSLKATLPFNAVEVVLDGAYNGYRLEVFEFCSDSKR